jgi:glycerol uptake facilitator-like aquaporin
VTLARGLSDTFAGIRLADVPAFIIAQFLGSFAAVALCRFLLASAPGVRGAVEAGHLEQAPRADSKTAAL